MLLRTVTPSPRTHIRLATAAICVVLAVFATGCSKDADSESPGSSNQTTQPSDQPSSTQVFPSMGDDFRGVLADVTTEDCPTNKGAVEAKGTVLNSAKDPQDILITVVWLKKNTGDSIDLGYFAAKDVPSGESVDWIVKGDLDRKAGRCVVAAMANKSGTLK